VTLNADLSGTAQRYITADRQRLKQVVLNLLSNAVKYNRPGGAVDVICSLEDGGRMRIAVKDTGIGIAPEYLGRVFSPFERLGADETPVEGTGLGLALSKRLVEAMDGTMGLTTARGVGSTFWLELPLAVSQDELAAPALADLPPAVNGNGAAATILYIEDNLSNLRLIERLLARWPDVDLLTAMQGRLGLDLAREHQPDVVLLDLHLPDMLGDQVLQELRSDPRTQDMAVVMVSADATPGQVARLLSAGAQAYLTKPIDVKQFFDVLEHLLQERRK
jgi:CheY-like chemotaxis protein/anti-sigma regulatory factor (Ser/Thr protein kinase)